MYRFLIILFVLLSINSFSQPLIDGFNKGKGNLDLVVSYSFENYKQYYAAPGLIDLGRKTNVVGLYSAFGITDNWDVQASLPYINTVNQSGIQDLSLVSKVKFSEISFDKGRLSFLVSNGISMPMSDYETETLFALGQKATTFDNRLITQFFMNNGLFLMLQSGFSYRLNPVPSSFPVAFKVGLAKAKNYIDLWIDYQKGMNGFSYRDGLGTSFREFTVSYLRAGFTYYKTIKDYIGSSLNILYTFQGQNVGKSTIASLALIFKFKTISE